MQSPSGAMTWTSRIWFARNGKGGQTREPSSLSQMSRAFRQGVLAPDVEVAIDGVWVWENVRLVLARYASLAPPNAHDLRESGRASEGFPELELTLTGQHDGMPLPPESSDDVTVPAPGPPVPVVPPMAAPLPAPRPPLPHLPPPPAVPALDERARRAAPTIPPVGPRSFAPNDGVESAFDVAIPERLPNYVFLACVAVAVLALLVGGGIGVQACSERLADAVDARTTLIAVLVGLAWLLGSTVVAAAIAVLGRAAAGILLVARKIDERPR
ncbi:MAG TPA: hypothetical protein VF765_33265 [Polyangiaceae bacterium]